MKLHWLETFGFTGIFIAFAGIVFLNFSWTGDAMVAIAGICVMRGQHLRHQEFMKRLKERQ